MTRQAGIYLRISSDPSGERLGVTRQRRDCEAKAKAEGWPVFQVYEDNDVSASSGKRRPAYEQMLEAIRTGRITAVIVWDLDRLTRRPIEIEQFIELADTHQIALASVGGDVDLSTDNGRLFARIKGAVARAEVERKGSRQKSANAQAREQGKPPSGRRQFGYAHGGLEVVDTEADLIRASARELLGGTSMHEITRKMNKSGLLTTAAGQWSSQTTRRLLASPRIAGLVQHGGEVVGSGNWPAILDIDTHRAIRALLSDPARHRAGPPRNYLLSGVATCETCGAFVFGTKDAQLAKYRCMSRKHVTTKADPIDEMVEAVIVERLASPDAVALFAKPEGANRGKDLQKEERGLRVRLDGLAEAYAGGDIDRAQLRAGSDRIRRRLEAVTAELVALAQVPDVGVLVTAKDVLTAWRDLSISRRRKVLRLLMTIKLVAPGRGVRAFNPDNVIIDWQSS